jgi:hypothetical protein
MVILTAPLALLVETTALPLGNVLCTLAIHVAQGCALQAEFAGLS